MPEPRPHSECVCLVGAGSSGLAAARALADRGIPFDGYERGSDIGGIWRYRNDSGRSPAYASLETNTSRDRTSFRVFPMTDAPAGYLEHSRLLGYFEDFADEFGLRDAFRFRTEVTRVRLLESRGEGPDTDRDGIGEGEAEVTVRDLDGGIGETRRYRAVLVASGHHWDARMPDFPGTFEGDVIHSRVYRNPEDPVPIAGRRVLVVGIGNSACDIGCEAAGVAARTLISTRRRAHVLPKFLLGRPLDRWITPLTSRLPVRVQAAALGTLVRLGRGDQRRFGIPRPAHRLGEEHPTISQALPGLVRAGRIELRPDIERLEGRRVRFVDGSADEVDVIVCATGYHVSFPFLDGALLDRIDPPADGAPVRENGRIAGNRIRLYRRVVPPGAPGLYFVGLIQPLGAIPPLAEAQAEWVADLLAGEARLPSGAEMRAAILAEEARLEARFVASSRHTLEVDFHPYLRALHRERRGGRARAMAAWRGEAAPP